MTNDHYTGLHRYKTLPSSQTPLLDSAGRVTMEVKLRSGRKRKFMTAEAWVLDASFPWTLESPRITQERGWKAWE